MERKEFLALLGTGSAAFLTFGCLGGCSKSDDDSGNNGTGGNGGTGKKDFTLNLNDTANSSLKTKGNAILKDGVIVAYTTTGNYIAVSSSCTHQGATVGYDSAGNKFVCPLHGSVFNENGAVTTGPATTALKQYKTTLTGDNLRVYE